MHNLLDGRKKIFSYSLNNYTNTGLHFASCFLLTLLQFSSTGHSYSFNSNFPAECRLTMPAVVTHIYVTMGIIPKNGVRR